MLQPGRSFSNGSQYRYGFNGKEKDDEVKGEGAQYDYGFRIYDPRMGRFLSTDPLLYSYPWYTPYQFAGNKPIAAIDLDGLEEYVVINFRNRNNTINRTEIYTITDKQGEAQNQEVKQVVHGERTGAPVAMGSVLVFDVFNFGQINQIMTINQNRNKEGSKLSREEKSILQSSNLHDEGEGLGDVANDYPRLSSENKDIEPGYSTKLFDLGDGFKRYTAIRTYNTQSRVITPPRISFTPQDVSFGSAKDAATVNQIAASAPNSVVVGPPITNSDGSISRTTTTVTSLVTVNLSTSALGTSSNTATNVGTTAQMMKGRFETIKKQLVSQGVPAANVVLGNINYGVNPSNMNNQVNQTSFTITTSRSTQTTIRRR